MICRVLRPPHSMRGYVLLALLTILAAMSAVMLVGRLKNTSSNFELQHQRLAYDMVQDALLEAKWALIVKALNEDNTPGSMLCQDADGDGDSEGSCAPTSAMAPARLPYKTLDIAPPRNGSQECLWYALSPDFRSFISPDIRSNTKANQHPINPDNAGSLILHRVTGDVGQQAIALLIAPGVELGGQTRLAFGSAGCKLGAANNFLESYDSVKNEYVSIGANGNVFNDRVVAISKNDLMKPLIKTILTSFSSPGTANALLSEISSSGLISGTLATVRTTNPVTQLQFDQALFANTVDTTQLPINGCNKSNSSSGYKAPLSWLCFNNWYNYLDFNANLNTLSISLDKGLPTEYTCSAVVLPGGFTKNSIMCG